MKSDSQLKQRNSNKNKSETVDSKTNESVKKSGSKTTDSSKQENDDKVPAAKYGPMPTFPRQRVWTRMVLILSVLTIVWFTSKDQKETVLASKKDVLQHRGQSFECSPSFQEEIKNYPSCIPKKCGRYISDKLITSNEADALLKLAKSGLSFGGSDGCASILDLHSGALSYGKSFINIYKLENIDQIFSPTDLAMYKIVKTKIQHAVAQNFGVQVDSLYLTHPTFFSRLTGGPPASPHDEYWHPHVDKETYESFHYTSLLYLTDFDDDFTGGRLIFIDSNRNVTLEPRKGRVAMFSSGEENLHFVERVKTGTRFTITVSFTCDQTKSISDPVLRKK